MKEADAIAAGPLTRAFAAWNRFWFQPANPTTLGLMRICCGLLVFYVHYAYSYDLWQFMGKDAWLSLSYADRARKTSPVMLPSTSWAEVQPTLYLPGDRENRDALFTWLESLPDDKTARLRMIEYMKKPDDAPVDFSIPQYVRDLNHFSRVGPPDDFEPSDPANQPQFATRWQLVRFIKALPDDREARLRKLAYMREWSIDPDLVDQFGSATWSVWFHVTDPAWMVVTHVGILAVMLMFAAGFCTRITSVLSWLAALSYINRSQVTLFGGDTMLNVLLLYLMIAPSGAALSVDRYLAHWWARRQARRAGRPEPEWTPPVASTSANFALRLIQIHFCIIYMASGLSKLQGGWWWNGNAVYYTMINYEFAPMHREYYQALMRFLVRHRWLWEIVVTGGSYATLFLEIGLPFLVWHRTWRPIMVTASLMLHVSIAVLMGLVAFSLLMGTMVMAFIPGEMVEQVLAVLRRRLLGDRAVPNGSGSAVRPSDSGSREADEEAPVEEKAEAEPVLQSTGEPEKAITREKDKGKRKKR